jgi:beta-lactamase regulating signal transducer with metallopeptidase domain
MNLEWFLFEFAGLFYMKAGLVLVAGVAASLLLKNHSATARYWAWNLCLLLLLAIIPVALWVPRWELALIAPGYSSLPPLDSVQFAGDGIPARTVTDLLNTDAFDNNHDLGFWEMLWGGLLLLWVIGAVVLCAKLMADLLSLASTSRLARPVPEQWRDLVTSCRERAGCRLPVQVKLTDRIGSPLMWGLLRPTVLLPAAAAHWSHERLRMVLLHELLHAARFDHTMMVLSQWVRYIYWGNPLAWIAVRQHSIERELSCDERVVDCGNDHLPIWSPDGKSIVFSAERGGNEALYWVAVDGGDVRMLEGPMAAVREAYAGR